MSKKPKISFRKKIMTIVHVYSVVILPIFGMSYLVLRHLGKLAGGSNWPTIMAAIYVAATLVIIIILYFVIKRISRKVMRPVVAVANDLHRLSLGDLDIQTTFTSGDEIGQLCNNLHTMVDGIRYEIEILNKIKEGDYSFTVTPRSEHDEIMLAVNALAQKQRVLVNKLSMVAGQISAASGEIAGGSQSLAEGSNEQAAAIEQFTGTVLGIQKKSRENASQTQEVIDAVREYSDIVKEIGNDMTKMTETMSDINLSAKRISAVSDMIENIAFQTNILSLNAAVEAARAGSQGKGFAVVADEVRELSAKSAEAARETTRLIKEDLTNVEIGNSIVQGAAAGMEKIKQIAGENEIRLSGMSVSTKEQSEAIDAISEGITQIAMIVQADSALAQQSAAAAAELASQATELDTLADSFVIHRS